MRRLVSLCAVVCLVVSSALVGAMRVTPSSKEQRQEFDTQQVAPTSGMHSVHSMHSMHMSDMSDMDISVDMDSGVGVGVSVGVSVSVDGENRLEYGVESGLGSGVESGTGRTCFDCVSRGQEWWRDATPLVPQPRTQVVDSLWSW